jgi:hypothetical protein
MDDKKTLASMVAGGAMGVSVFSTTAIEKIGFNPYSKSHTAPVRAHVSTGKTLINRIEALSPPKKAKRRPDATAQQDDDGDDDDDDGTRSSPSRRAVVEWSGDEEEDDGSDDAAALELYKRRRMNK